MRSKNRVYRGEMKHLSSQELLSRTKTLVSDERRATLALIEHLEEIQARGLYASMGYASMWEFATQELGLSEGSAQRRIQAMRLVRDVPEAKASLADGSLSLSNAAKLQGFRQQEKKRGRKPDPRKLVEEVKSCSQRECELALLALSPEPPAPKEGNRIVSAREDRELKITVSPEVYEKIQKLKGLLAHARPDASLAELLEYMTDECLTRLEKKKGVRDDAQAAAAAVTDKKALPVGRRVYLPAALRRAVWARAKNQCEVTAGARRCSSQYRLEVDHAIPLAQGGSNELSNLRLACWQHNHQGFAAARRSA
jgi:hypothetical protein